MSITGTARPAIDVATPTAGTPAGHAGTLNGQRYIGTQHPPAVEGQDSPQAQAVAVPKEDALAGTQAAQSAIGESLPMASSLAGQVSGRGQSRFAPHPSLAPAPSVPGAQPSGDPHRDFGTGDQAPPAAKPTPTPTGRPPLADPLLALAADVLSDLEKVRIANENRLRQLTRSEEDKDGETRGFGLDEAHPDVRRLAALVDMLADAEHKAALNLGRLMRQHPMGPWLAAQKGIGEKQGARLLAAIGDPYIRPEIVREDGTVELERPRLVSELWALCGYHVIPVDHPSSDSQRRCVDGEQDGHLGQKVYGSHNGLAGVAPKRARGQKANWSGTAKMRAYLVAESCIKQSGTPYRKVYDATREKYGDAVHAVECVRCGPKGKPAQPGSPLSAGHQHARALRAVAKEVLRDLWREAKRIHEGPPPAGQTTSGAHCRIAAGGASETT